MRRRGNSCAGLSPKCCEIQAKSQGSSSDFPLMSSFETAKMLPEVGSANSVFLLKEFKMWQTLRSSKNEINIAPLFILSKKSQTALFSNGPRKTTMPLKNNLCRVQNHLWAFERQLLHSDNNAMKNTAKTDRCFRHGEYDSEHLDIPPDPKHGYSAKARVWLMNEGKSFTVQSSNRAELSHRQSEGKWAQ